MNEEAYKLNHSAEHIFAQAVKELYGDKVTLAVAHINENSFSNDSKWDIEVSEKLFEEIEQRMREIIKKDLPISSEEISLEMARELFKNNPFKIEWAEQWASEGKALTIFKTGDEYYDLCKGPHLKSTGMIGAFKLSGVSGAYWRGNEKNVMLTRISGHAFINVELMKSFFENLEEAKKRDHRKIGKEMGLFTFSELVGSGLPLFTPRGAFLRHQLASYSEELQQEAGFERVWIPHITKSDLYKKSGHWEKYKGELLIAHSNEADEDFVLKPMNCPHHIQIYSSEQRSYRDLPLRFFETTTNYRDEKTGELLGLSRVRSLTQDDAHIFCTLEQVENEFEKIMEMIKKLYTSLDLKFVARLSFRSEIDKSKYLGEESDWIKSQDIIKNVAEKLKLNYFIAEGEAAFYGPKIDIMVKDSLGREWQCATQQLDFQMPRRFELEYIDSDGKRRTPVMIHKALLGAIERFLSVYIEHTGGNFPLWLSYEKGVVIPISTEKHSEYAMKIQDILKQNGFKFNIDIASETLGNRIRKAQGSKMPYMVIVGDKEIENEKVSIRFRSGESREFSINDFIVHLKDLVDSKSNNL